VRALDRLVDLGGAAEIVGGEDEAAQAKTAD
jgi:hypothetical protein